MGCSQSKAVTTEIIEPSSVMLTRRPSSTILTELAQSIHGTGGFRPRVVHIEPPTSGLTIEEVYEGVHDGEVLGIGIGGKVRLGVHRATGTEYAIKCLDLRKIKTSIGIHQLREELAILVELDHPNIVKLEEVYECRNKIYMVQELCRGGELYDRLDEQPEEHYTEAQCARLVRQMLKAVRYIHSKGIIHRDLKLENFLFDTRDPDSDLKMIDFGLSKHFKNGDVHHEQVGTRYTVAPEVLKGSYDEKVDVWAIGVITFLLFSGDSPFGGCGEDISLDEVSRNILTANFVFEPEEIWNDVSLQAKKFIKSLLVVDPAKRMTVEECQNSEWLRQWAEKEKKVGDDNLNPDIVNALLEFRECSEIRRVMCELISFTLCSNQLNELTREFEKLDVDQNGQLSLSCFKKVLLGDTGKKLWGGSKCNCILTEMQVEEIFNSMRVDKSVTHVHYHDFIAAGLSQCKVDKRNLRIAFDRLDADHKGHITFKDVMEYMGTSARTRQDSMKRLWGDSLKECGATTSKKIYFDNFVELTGPELS